MRRALTLLLLALLVLGGGACGDASPGATAPPAPTTAPAGTPEEPQGPPAPDFELELASGETFRLSRERRPVYLVFWAEW